jgi:hypothetical protein
MMGTKPLRSTHKRIDTMITTKPLLLYLGLPIAVVMSSYVVARAYDSAWISTGQPISAASLKGTLDELHQRLAALEVESPAVTSRMTNGPSVPASVTLTATCETTKKHVLILASGTAQLTEGSVYVQVALNVDGVQLASTYAQGGGDRRLMVPTMTAYLSPAAAGAHPIQIVSLQGALFDARDFWTVTCVELR